MMTRRAMIVCLAMATTWPSALDAGPSTIVAFGDSTTAPRAGLIVYAQLLEKGLSEQGIAAKVINAGVPGSSTADARKRFERDVLAQTPNVVIIQFGINDSAVDVWKNPPETEPRVPIAEFAENLRYFVSTLKERQIKVILMTPNPLRWTPALKQMYGKPPYQPDRPDGMNVLLRDYAKTVRQIAHTERVSLVDVYAAFEAYGRKAGKSVDKLLLDGMHPNGDGHRLIANQLLKQYVLQTLRGRVAGLLDYGRVATPPNLQIPAFHV